MSYTLNLLKLLMFGKHVKPIMIYVQTPQCRLKRSNFAYQHVITVHHDVVPFNTVLSFSCVRIASDQGRWLGFSF
jgi:hypothetical protein